MRSSFVDSDTRDPELLGRMRLRIGPGDIEALCNVKSGNIHVGGILSGPHGPLQEPSEGITSGLGGILEDSHCNVHRLVADQVQHDDTLRGEMRAYFR